ESGRMSRYPDNVSRDFAKLPSERTVDAVARRAAERDRPLSNTKYEKHMVPR
ncbi:hypothetical protein K0M31_004482, partial [Melipona bicolor]